MPGGYLYGWDGGNSVWRKMVCNADGKLIIDPTAVFEDSPTDGELKKGPTSNWAFDHKADASAHHAKYTDENSRAAIDNIFWSDGKATKDINFQGHKLKNITDIYFLDRDGSNDQCRMSFAQNTNMFYIYNIIGAGGYDPIYMMLYNGSAYEKVAVEPVVDTKITTHRDIANAHHDKYTDANAQAACNLYGDLYWSCPGIHFDAYYPATQTVTKDTVGFIKAGANGIYVSASVFLPDGATITKAIVYGNVAAEDENWYIRRIRLTDKSYDNLGTALVNTEDISISNNIVDNSLYGYVLTVITLDTNDEIWGARVTYNL